MLQQNCIHPVQSATYLQQNRTAEQSESRMHVPHTQF